MQYESYCMTQYDSVWRSMTYLKGLATELSWESILGINAEKKFWHFGVISDDVTNSQKQLNALISFSILKY